MKYKLTITGMMCINCQNNVTKALMQVDGVSEAIVDWEAGTAIVTCSESVSDKALKNAIECMESKRDFLVASIKEI